MIGRLQQAAYHPIKEEDSMATSKSGASCHISRTILPNSIVRDPNLKPLGFCILLRFQYMMYKQKSSTIEVSLSAIKSRLSVSSDSTMKTALNQLKGLGYILNMSHIVNKKPITIEVNQSKLERTNQFTQLPTALIDYVSEIGHTGIRLLYYYESFVNGKTGKVTYAFPGFKRICDEANINQDTLHKYNKLLIKKKLLRIDKHKKTSTLQYDDQDREIVTKYNNHYYVRHENIVI